MKRFVLYAGSQYYPDGGIADYKGSFDELHEAVIYATEHRPDACWDWCDVVDTQDHIVYVSDVKRHYHPEPKTSFAFISFDWGTE